MKPWRLAMIDPATLLPQPHREDYRENKMWVDEQIWGYRLWDSESPWMLFLEFLTVAEAMHRTDQLFDGLTSSLLFKPYKRLYLRNILFNNEPLFQIDNRYPDTGVAWTQWLEWMEADAKEVHRRDVSSLKARFKSFNQFASLIGMLRRSAVESQTNKRWSSRFGFPFGPNALYEDLDINKAGNVSRDHINFGRTGELLYLMLSRSASAAKLKQQFAQLLSGDNPWNKLL